MLDLVPVRGNQTSADAVAASVALARTADRAGYRRYWVAEHHNMPAVAATNPPVLIGLLAGATERIRVGSGGVMLPNHAPLVVAEQFALLEAAFPGRIDLGIGRAPGTDPVTRYALRHGAGGVDDNARRPLPGVRRRHHRDDGRRRGRHVGRRPHPRAARHPAGRARARRSGCWGPRTTRPGWPPSADCPTSFAHHFSGSGTAEALELYRSGFRPSPELDAPQTFLTVNVSVADTADEAHRLALPQLHAMVALRTGGPLRTQLLVEEAEAVALPEDHARLLDAMRRRWVIGTPDEAAAEIAQLAATYGVDEVMVHPVAGRVRRRPGRRGARREATLELLARHAGAAGAPDARSRAASTG